MIVLFSVLGIFDIVIGILGSNHGSIHGYWSLNYGYFIELKNFRIKKHLG